MEITEVRIKMADGRGGNDGGDRCLAFAIFTLGDAFVVKDAKVVDGGRGLFVAMPSRKLTDRCHACGTKNHLRSRFCNHCGSRLDGDRAAFDAGGRARLHADVAHPVNARCREAIQAAVLAAYVDELERSRVPGYASRYDDPDDAGLARAEASVT